MDPAVDACSLSTLAAAGPIWHLARSWRDCATAQSAKSTRTPDFAIWSIVVIDDLRARSNVPDSDPRERRTSRVVRRR